MSEDLLKEISGKLDKLIAVVAIQGKERDDQVMILSSLGYSNSDISKLLVIPKGTIDWIRANYKKKK